MIPLGILIQQVIHAQSGGGGGTASTLLTDLVSWYDLGSTPDLLLDSHDSNTLTNFNTVTYDGTEDAAYFDKTSNQYLYNLSMTDFTTGPEIDWTYACKVKFDSLNNLPVIVMIGDGGVNGSNSALVSYVDASDQIVFLFGTPAWSTLTGPVVSVDTWYDIVIWHDAANDTFYVSINDGTPISFDYASATPVTKAGLWIGRYHNTPPDRVMDGYIKCCGLWNRQLTASEITEYGTVDGYIDLGTGSSDFDDAVAALSPDLYYDFQDTDLSTGLEDQSGNSYDLSIPATYQGASDITAIRDTVSQAARFVAHNAGNSYKGSLYEAVGHSVNMVSLFLDTDNWCMQLTFRSSNNLGVGDMTLAGMAEGNTDEDVRPQALRWLANTYKIEHTARHTNGWILQPSPSALNDGVPHIITACNDASGTGEVRFYVDGVLITAETETAQTTDLNYTGGNIRMNVQGHSSYTSQEWDTDHFAAWGDGSTLPTHAEILDMHSKYLAET